MALFKNKESKKEPFIINRKKVDLKINEYERVDTLIISNSIKEIIKKDKKLKTIKEKEYTRDFSTIALLIENKIGDNHFKPRAKELMIEGAFSQYQYLNKLNKITIDEYIDTINKHLDTFENYYNKVKEYDGTDNGAYSSIRRTLKLNEAYFDYDERYFISLFIHELNHCYRNNLVENSSKFKMQMEYTFGKFQKEEMGNQAVLVDILAINFPEFIKEKTIEKPFKNGVFEFNLPDEKYLETVYFGVALNKILGEKFAKTFFDKNDFYQNNLEKNFGVITKNLFKNFMKNYEDIASKTKIDVLKYGNMEDSFCKLISYHIYKKGLDLNDFKDVLLQYPIYTHNIEAGEKINRNEKIFRQIEKEIDAMNKNVEYIKNLGKTKLEIVIDDSKEKILNVKDKIIDKIKYKNDFDL